MSATENTILPGFEDWFNANKVELETIFNASNDAWTNFDDLEAFALEVFIQQKQA